jgi:cation:H+ antiporter
LNVLETMVINGEIGYYFPHTQYIVMMLFGLILIPLGLRNKIGRLTGIVLISGYIAFYIYLFMGRAG